MVHSEIKRIGDLKLEVLLSERRFDTLGHLSVHPTVASMYLQKEYDKKPKSFEEAQIIGEKNFNGLVSSFVDININEEGTLAKIVPTRYLIGQAMRDCVKDKDFSDEQIKQLSPDMANVSLVAPLIMGDRVYLLSQIKGKALGEGEIHAALAAGNVDAHYLTQPSPLSAMLKQECSEEIGMDLSDLGDISFVFMIDERRTAQINFASVSKAKLENVIEAYAETIETKRAALDSLEVMGLTLLPIAAIENGGGVTPLLSPYQCEIPNVASYFPTKNGLKKIEEKVILTTDRLVCVGQREVRPYTRAVLSYLTKKDNIAYLLEIAGI